MELAEKTHYLSIGGLFLLWCYILSAVAGFAFLVKSNNSLRKFLLCSQYLLLIEVLSEILMAFTVVIWKSDMEAFWFTLLGPFNDFEVFALAFASIYLFRTKLTRTNVPGTDAGDR